MDRIVPHTNIKALRDYEGGVQWGKHICWCSMKKTKEKKQNKKSKIHTQAKLKTEIKIKNNNSENFKKILQC